MRKIIEELMKFSSDILSLGHPIEDNRIENFELKFGVNLPSEFKTFMKKFNGLDMMGTEVLPFDSLIENSIEGTYYYEHNKTIQPQSKELVTFSPDGRGNFYCLDTSKINNNGTCPVVFFQSLYLYSENDRPEVCNETFADWVGEVVIEWTLEDYNYDGSEKLSN